MVRNKNESKTRPKREPVSKERATELLKEAARLNHLLYEYVRPDYGYLRYDDPILLDYMSLLKKHIPQQILSTNLKEWLVMEEETETRSLSNSNLKMSETSPPKSQVKIEPTSPFQPQPSICNHPSTVLRAPNDQPKHTLTVNTPLGNRSVRVAKMPRTIAPKLKHDTNVVAGRLIGADEMGFSINGSPIVGPTGVTSILDEVLSKPEDEMTPTSREIVLTLKAALRKKLMDKQDE